MRHRGTNKARANTQKTEHGLGVSFFGVGTLFEGCVEGNPNETFGQFGVSPFGDKPRWSAALFTD